MPERIRLSAHHEPTPPTPKMMTRLQASLSIAWVPRSSSDRLNIASSIATMQSYRFIIGQPSLSHTIVRIMSMLL